MCNNCSNSNVSVSSDNSSLSNSSSSEGMPSLTSRRQPNNDSDSQSSSSSSSYDSSSAATRLQQHSQEVSSPTYNNANAERIGFFTAAASANIDNIDQIMQGHEILFGSGREQQDDDDERDDAMFNNDLLAQFILQTMMPSVGRRNGYGTGTGLQLFDPQFTGQLFASLFFGSSAADALLLDPLQQPPIDVRRPDQLVCPTCMVVHLPVEGTERVAIIPPTAVQEEDETSNDDAAYITDDDDSISMPPLEDMNDNKEEVVFGDESSSDCESSSSMPSLEELDDDAKNSVTVTVPLNIDISTKNDEESTNETNDDEEEETHQDNADEEEGDSDESSLLHRNVEVVKEEDELSETSSLSMHPFVEHDR